MPSDFEFVAEHFEDATMVTPVPSFMALYRCTICGAPEKFSVMGPAVGLGQMPSACADPDCILKARALARGEPVEVHL